MKKEENKSIKDILAKINKEFGENSVIQVDNASYSRVDVISTGSLSLDAALGVGGLPLGRIVEIFGPEAGGKTTLALSVVANAQKTGGNVLYVDAEHSLDLEYASKIGVDVKKMYISQPESGEDALNIAERLISTGSFKVVVIDSVAALEPKVEFDADIGNQTMGLKARLMSQAMRKLSPVAFRTNTMIIFINQVRMKIGQMAWGNPETTPGGMALKFHSSVRLDIRRISSIKDGDDIVGNLVRVKVVKNKVSAPYKQAEFCILFGSGISLETEVFNSAVEKEVIEKSGNTYSFGDCKLGVGVKNAINCLKESPDIVEKIKEKIK